MTNIFKIFISIFKSDFYCNASTKRNLIFATILTISMSFLINYPAVLLGDFIDKINNLDTFSFNLAIPFLLIISGMILLKEMINILRKYLVENSSVDIEKTQTKNLIENVLKIDYDILKNKYEIGELTHRINTSVEGFVSMVKLIFLDFFPSFFLAITALILVFLKNKLIFLFMVFVIPIGLFIVFKQINSQKGIRIQLLKLKEKINSKIVNLLYGIEIIKAYNTKNYEIKKVEKEKEISRKKEMKHHLHMAFYDGLKYINESFFYILIIGLSIYLSSIGEISKGDILTYSLLFISVLNPLKEIHKILDHLSENIIKFENLTKLYDEKKDISFFENIKTKKEKIDSSNLIEVKNLTFVHKNKKIFNNLNINFKNNQQIGLIGESGCGKSTFVKILLRLHNTYQGDIFIENVNLKNINRKELKKIFFYISQNSYLFNGTLKENLTYSLTENVSEKKLKQILKLVNLNKKFKNLNFKINENGNNLSGGEKQRICLARIFLADFKILILDEATSALDILNEKSIQKNIETFFKNKLIITIVHRVQILKNTNQIIQFENGKIKQKGTFEEFLKNNKIFKNLK
jgi:ATP-binding cassette subfamily B protein